MNRKIFFAICILSSLFLFSACSHNEITTSTSGTQGTELSTEVNTQLNTDAASEEPELSQMTTVGSESQPTDSANEIDSGETLVSNTDSDTENEDVSTEEIFLTFYQISQDAFLEFIENPSVEILTAPKTTSETVALGERYIRGSALFLTNYDPISYLSTPERAEEYLKEKNITAKVEHVFFFDTPRMPIFVWIVGENFSGMVEFNLSEDYNDEAYVDVFYTQEEFRQACQSLSASITIEGQPFQGEHNAILYHRGSDVPVFTILKGLGATVSEREGDLVRVQYKGENFTFDLEKEIFIKEGAWWRDFLVNSGPTACYEKNGELMLDGGSLGSIIFEMGTHVYVESDRENRVVNIVFAPQ